MISADAPSSSRAQSLHLLAKALEAEAVAGLDPNGLANSFDALTGAIRIGLPQVLIAWAREKLVEGNDSDVVRRASSVRNWLRLWLVLDVAQVDVNRFRAIMSAERKQALLHAIAFVLREGIRAQLYHGAAGFEVDRDRVGRSLIDVVAWHAWFRFGIPSTLGLAKHLHEMRASGRRRWRAGDGHVEHVLEVYVLGAFFLSLRVPSRAGAETVLDRLAASNQSREADHLRQVFVLASLFHDVGMLFMPDLSYWQGVAKELPELRLATMVGVIDLSMVASVDRCRAEVASEWDDHLQGRDERPRPDHALIGAWYLRDWVRRQNPRPAATVVTDAERAIILHGALNLPIDCARDPIAALLVFCDELCDWNPSRGEHDGHEPRRELNGDTSRTPRRDRAREVSLSGLSFLIEGDKLVAELKAAPQGMSWPAVEVLLHEPLDLDSAILEIWLRSARNLGRIVASPGGEWRPRVRLSNLVPPRLANVSLCTFSLLDAVGDPTTAVWLVPRNFGEADGREFVDITPGCWPATNLAPSPNVGEIVKAAMEVVRKRERTGP